jgi:hypothetical protein
MTDLVTATAQVRPIPPTATGLLPDGVYIGLSEDRYFRQRRLGGTCGSKLFRAPADWWWSSSEWNERFEPRKWTLANDRDFGHAFHALLLEGEDVYRAKTVSSPFENFTTKDAKLWRDEQLAERRVIVTEKMDYYIRHMVALVLNHPQLADAMAKGLSEVSVLWTDPEGRRLRARFDKLLPAFILDPKSFGPHNTGADEEDRALRIVAKLNYDVQRYIYDVAREQMIEHIEAGQVYGGTAEEVEWIYRFPEADRARAAERQEFYPNGHPDQQSKWSWMWLFVQKPSNSKGHAPVVLPLERPQFDRTWRTGQEKWNLAMANYDYYVSRFGLGPQPNEDGEVSVPWATIRPVWRPLDEDFPPWLSDIRTGLSAPQGEESESDNG